MSRSTLPRWSTIRLWPASMSPSSSSVMARMSLSETIAFWSKRTRTTPSDWVTTSVPIGSGSGSSSPSPSSSGSGPRSVAEVGRECACGWASR